MRASIKQQNQSKSVCKTIAKQSPYVPEHSLKFQQHQYRHSLEPIHVFPYIFCLQIDRISSFLIAFLHIEKIIKKKVFYLKRLPMKHQIYEYTMYIWCVHSVVQMLSMHLHRPLKMHELLDTKPFFLNVNFWYLISACFRTTAFVCTRVTNINWKLLHRQKKNFICNQKIWNCFSSSQFIEATVESVEKRIPFTTVVWNEQLLNVSRFALKW